MDTSQPVVSTRILQLWVLIFLCLYCTACYSVRLTSAHGIPEPDPTNQDSGFYRNLRMRTINTVIKLNAFDEGFSIIKDCPGDGFYSVEYRVTFGGVLLNALTFGRRKKVRICYVCLKENN